MSVMVPPVPERAMADPLLSTPNSLLIEIDTEPLAVGAIVAESTATTPVLIVAEFRPEAMHVTVPLPGLQLMPLPAAVRAGPAATEKETILAAG